MISVTFKSPRKYLWPYVDKIEINWSLGKTFEAKLLCEKLKRMLELFSLNRLQIIYFSAIRKILEFLCSSTQILSWKYYIKYVNTLWLSRSAALIHQYVSKNVQLSASISEMWRLIIFESNILYWKITSSRTLTLEGYSMEPNINYISFETSVRHGISNEWKTVEIWTRHKHNRIVNWLHQTLEILKTTCCSPKINQRHFCCIFQSWKWQELLLMFMREVRAVLIFYPAEHIDCDRFCKLSSKP